MKNNRIGKWKFTLAGAGGVLGMTVGQLIAGKLSFAGVLGSLTAFFIFFIIDMVRNRKKKDNTPDIDERTRQNMTKYYAVIANVFLATAFLLLAIITYIGIEQISIMYLWLFITAYMMISGIGAFILMKR